MNDFCILFENGILKKSSRTTSGSKRLLHWQRFANKVKMVEQQRGEAEGRLAELKELLAASQAQGADVARQTVALREQLEEAGLEKGRLQEEVTASHAAPQPSSPQSPVFVVVLRNARHAGG